MQSAQYTFHHDISKQQWDDFVAVSPQGSLYARSWYLDVVMPNWDAIVVKKAGCWQAVMPICVRHKYGIGYALQVPFAQYLGVLFAPLVGKNNHIFHQKRVILNVLIPKIPVSIQLFSYNFSPTFDYFLPFHRNGFLVTPRTNLQLSLQPNLSEISAGFSTSILNHVKKAQQHGLTCREGTDIRLLSKRMLQYCFIQTEKEQVIVEALWQSARFRGQGFLLEVVDHSGSIHCSGLFLIENQKAIFLASAVDREKRHLGSNSLLVYEAIRLFKSMGINALDFKGSMLQGVEQFIWGFNPEQLVYYTISKNQLSPVVDWLHQMLKTR